ncbi:hypothetical protein B0H10DRAFT_1955806 [Mycena sp. CBHHK59/15]|nr:hypothetical protein B0H10DRAFT_1955806 [Mycena sp. CBHHK59/15]
MRRNPIEEEDQGTVLWQKKKAQGHLVERAGRELLVWWFQKVWSTKYCSRTRSWPYYSGRVEENAPLSSGATKAKAIVVDVNGKTKADKKRTYTNDDLPFPPDSHSKDLKHFQETFIPNTVDWNTPWPPQ